MNQKENKPENILWNNPQGKTTETFMSILAYFSKM